MARKLFLLLLLLPVMLPAEPNLFSWKTSVGTLSAASAFDAVSSWRQPEANPLLRNSQGRFGWRGVAVKTGIAAGVVIGQYCAIRRWPKLRKWLTIMNFGWTGVHAGVGARNMSVRGGPGR